MRGACLLAQASRDRDERTGLKGASALGAPAVICEKISNVHIVTWVMGLQSGVFVKYSQIMILWVFLL